MLVIREMWMFQWRINSSSQSWHNDTVKFGLPSFVLMTDTRPANNQNVSLSWSRCFTPTSCIWLHGDDIRDIGRIVSSITGWKWLYSISENITDTQDKSLPESRRTCLFCHEHRWSVTTRTRTTSACQSNKTHDTQWLDVTSCSLELEFTTCVSQVCS